MPPRGLSFVGHGDFAQTGLEFAGYFRELGGMQPEDRVLDLGCGIGRMAIPLTDYLEGGSYAGFDVGRAMIRWCRRHITPGHPDFEFTWAPVYNGKYNPFGTISASEFRFPYEDSSFDFALATSLFTHLLPDDTRHYVAETARVLKPGGTCFFTFFLLTPDARREVADGRAMSFVHPIEGGGAILDPREPELGVAYPLEEVGRSSARRGSSCASRSTRASGRTPQAASRSRTSPSPAARPRRPQPGLRWQGSLPPSEPGTGGGRSDCGSRRRTLRNCRAADLITLFPSPQMTTVVRPVKISMGDTS